LQTCLTPFYAFAACAIGSGVFIFGGYDAEIEEQASVIKYDTEADTWSTLEPMLEADYGHSARVLNDLVYIVGAGDGREVLRFDPAS
jgi:N-acetylneuraminic acid mutarotase